MAKGEKRKAAAQPAKDGAAATARRAPKLEPAEPAQTGGAQADPAEASAEPLTDAIMAKTEGGTKAPKQEPHTASAAAAASASGSKATGLVHPARVRELRGGAAVGDGPVVYWMSRDQRMRDNWALLHACEAAAQRGVPVAVCFNLVTEYLHAGARQFGFMLRGLEQLPARLAEANIEFFMLTGDPVETVPRLVRETQASLLVTDFAVLRLGREWREKVAAAITIPFHEVDAHNVIPVWVASPKRETGARTLRSKVHKLLPEYFNDFPPVPRQAPWNRDPRPPPVDWQGLLAQALQRGAQVPEVDWAAPGEDAAWQALTDENHGFLSKKRLGMYASHRNDPNEPTAVSNLSAYLHFGQLSCHRAALEARKHIKTCKAGVEGFMEELIVRRELADNFCYYEPNYDNLAAAAPWARETLDKHRTDKREWLYTLEQLEKAETHDHLWNAAQLEMVHYGKLHGYMRMYWAKKILEWTESPEQALEFSIYLNDRWEIDGRDPNGYVGCMWSVAGIHDQGWPERPIFGKIRYMNYNGCKRKFNVDGYVQRIQKIVREVKISDVSKVQP